MTWADFYLFCFAFGFLFSALAVLAGHIDFGGHDVGDTGGADHGHSHHVAVFNAGTVAAFLAWFGGTGYLATKFYRLWFVSALAFALAAGAAGAAVVFWFLKRVLMREREDLDPADYDMVGVLGRVSGTIREGGIGEILFSRDGARRAAPARSDGTGPIPEGAEVVVTGYADGIAYVRRWEEMAGAE
jgi:membrane protein implicated in regulation of membrane protease activity